MRDELCVVWDVFANNELVRTTLNGVTKEWAMFDEGIVARENIPNWDHLLNEFIQEENQRGYVHGSSYKGNEEENVALPSKGNNKSKKGSK
jgi:hypothetical protein